VYSVFQSTLHIINAYFYDSTTGFNFDHPVFEEILDIVDNLHSQGLIMRLGYEYDGGAARYSVAALIPFYGTAMDFTRLDILPGSVYLAPTLNSSEGIALIHSESFAINANSNNQEAAWAFIRLMLSEEVQYSIFSTPYLDRKTVIDPILYKDKPFTLLRYESVLANLNRESIRRARLTANLPDYPTALSWNANRREFFSKVNRIYGRYDAPYIMHIILEHAVEFYGGNETMSDTIRNLNEAVDVYLRD